MIHINSTAYGGGVAELLHSLIPLSNALGVETQRLVMTPKDSRFFDVTKRIHNSCKVPRDGFPKPSWQSITVA